MKNHLFLSTISTVPVTSLSATLDYKAVSYFLRNVTFIYHAYSLTQAPFTFSELHLETVCSAQILHTHTHSLTHTHTCYTEFLNSALVCPSTEHFTSYLCYGHTTILSVVQWHTLID